MKQLLFALALIAVCSAFVSVNDSSLASSAEIAVDPAPASVNVFVHISAVKVGARGLKTARITKIVLAKDGVEGKNTFRASLKRVDGLLQFEIQMKQKVDRLVMPEGFVLSDRISRLLGVPKGVVMSGGSTMVRSADGLLQFEIQ
ncbi:hypothetical protein [Lewinella sp. W8]|uniref:hypothetical protein n=1 Tax=Lewinella sp. W8 TaxID=2528208 RepID=UPI001067C83E|nr:hypothetical protein [Lewinella sp. W8]MTB52427.1 hypothetical protein [Lewinella sp. W8]